MGFWSVLRNGYHVDDDTLLQSSRNITDRNYFLDAGHRTLYVYRHVPVFQ